MAAYLRPRRGTASGSTIVLKEGEIFLDTAKSSSATTLSSWGQIYVGNNTNNINALKPFVSLPENMVVNAFDTGTKTIDNIAAGQPLKTLFKAIKDVLSSHATSITNLNNDKFDKSGGGITGNLEAGGNVPQYLGTSDDPFYGGTTLFFNTRNLNLIDSPASISFTENDTSYSVKPSTTLSNDNTTIPTGGAVIDYLKTNYQPNFNQAQWTGVTILTCVKLFLQRTTYGAFGIANPTDGPTTNSEYCILFWGSTNRITVWAKLFTGTTVHTRSIFSGAWYNSWTKIIN